MFFISSSNSPKREAKNAEQSRFPLLSKNPLWQASKKQKGGFVVEFCPKNS
jgi:hypothetical protein